MPNPYTGQKRIKEVIYKVLQPTLKHQGWYLSKLIFNWETIIEKQWKNDIWPTRFAPSFKDKSKGVLYLRATHKGLQQAVFSKGMLIEKINMYLGYSAITDIKTQLWHSKTAPQPPRQHASLKPQPSLNIPDIKSQELKNALNDLGTLLNTSSK